ncbi:hypothetical protein Pmani_037484 [Petrolisthes manimaculis]|uniref:Major facilitator superfamily (MFS) profile domain-containing protein n=1 Tax=Petrolisthes manimaculis TaxID=1843537 RepID=A0AAE1NH65_9EUCA|nr:hypothetical protein Pmani_037484 [Petrolisthes manimaculis]KAK4289552.1 hypothetical protein Pmani_037484 [Petrolisthes manimaculis]KAK4289553.1 hypothetical protein Pmani_037484 [Petrolisthes manimaculis]
MFPTYASEHNWVCSDSWRQYLVVSVFWLGNTIGAWLWGVLSDVYGRRVAVIGNYGRRVAVIGSLFTYGVAGLTSVFVNNFYGFTILRFLTGSSHHTVSHLVFVLVVEYCGLKSRVIPLLSLMVSYTLLSIVTSVLAWVVWEWRVLLCVAPVCCLVLTLATRWLPESASWLIAKGRDEDATLQLTRVARINKTHLPLDMLQALLTQKRSRRGGSGGWRKGRKWRKKRRKWRKLMTEEEYIVGVGGVDVRVYVLLRSLSEHIQPVLWCVAELHLRCRGGDPACVCVPWLIHRAGRKGPLVVAYWTSALAGFVYAVVPQGTDWLVLTMGLLGRGSITGAYYISLQYGPEIFPTVVRGQGVAVAETLGGVAVFLSPLIVYLGEYERRAPLLIFAVLSVIGGAATQLLPETKGVTLPQTLTQAQHFAQQTAPRCFKKSRSSEEDMEDGTQQQQQQQQKQQ